MFDVAQIERAPPAYLDMSQHHSHLCGADKMLETIAIVLLVLWALGLVTSFTAGGLIHILLVVALVVLLFRFIRGRSI